MMRCKKCKKILGRYAVGNLCRRCKAPKTTKTREKALKEQAERRRKSSQCKSKGCKTLVSVTRKSGLCPTCLKKKQHKDRYTTCKNPGCDNTVHKEAVTGFCKSCWKENIHPIRKREHFGLMKHLLTAKDK